MKGVVPGTVDVAKSREGIRKNLHAILGSKRALREEAIHKFAKQPPKMVLTNLIITMGLESGEFMKKVVKINVRRLAVNNVLPVPASIVDERDPYYWLYDEVWGMEMGGSHTPSKFPALRCNMWDPSCSILLFPTANIVCAGTKSEAQGLVACTLFVGMLRKAGVDVHPGVFRVQNIVGTGWARFPIDLDLLAEDAGVYARYTPKIFPGLFLRSIFERTTAIVHRSGIFIIVGAKTVEESFVAGDMLYREVLVRYIDTQKKTWSSAKYITDVMGEAQAGAMRTSLARTMMVAKRQALTHENYEEAATRTADGSRVAKRGRV